ncbi:CHASE2 domain-containing protein [Luteimonas sp. MJ246]|uniref:CHASE2 domain-containing protein n=1 Tax=Luteimonas sp. MJ174 TaxID=3129237 RepID=UPI0031BA2FC8
MSNGSDPSQDSSTGDAHDPRPPRPRLAALRRRLGALAQRCGPREPAPDGLRGLPEMLAAWLRTLESWLQRLSSDPPSRQAALPLTLSHPQRPRGPLHALAAMRRNVSIALAAFLVMFVGAGILNWLDPFGLDRNSQAYSEHLNARAEAPFYDSAAQGDIVVVLITPDTLEQRDFAWPPRYEYYAEAIGRILADTPRALYVDVLARKARDYDGTLDYATQEISRASDASGVPVIFATETPGAPSLFSNDRGVGVAPMAWQAADSDYPLRLRPENVVPWRDAEPPVADACAFDSVALRLYRHACPGLLPATHACPTRGSQAALPPLPGCNIAAGAANLPEPVPHLVVQWGLQRPWHTPEPDGWRPACNRADAAPAAGWRIGAALKALYHSLLSGRDGEAVARTRERCPYTLTITEHELEYLPEGFLSDRIVILGVDLPGLEDSVATPVHGRLPGAYLHAMALDNLMHQGAGYRHRDAHTARWTSMLAGFALCLALALVLRSRFGARPLARRLLLAGLALLLAVLTSWLLGAVFHLPAPNWLAGFALFVLAAHRVTKTMTSPPPPPPPPAAETLPSPTPR